MDNGSYIYLNIEWYKIFSDEDFGRSARYEQLQAPKLTEQSEKMFAARMLTSIHGSFLNQALALYPNNPEPLLISFLGGYGVGIMPKELNKNIFTKLMEIGVLHGPGTVLFTALGLMTDFSDLRAMAAAFWSFSAEKGLVDSPALGATLGRLVRVGLAPVKRLTDSIETEMVNISENHSRHLATTVEFLLLTVGGNPASSIKRFLELYYELVSAGHRDFNPAILEFLPSWSQQKTYAKACRRLADLA